MERRVWHPLSHHLVRHSDAVVNRRHLARVQRDAREQPLRFERTAHGWAALRGIAPVQTLRLDTC